MKIFTMAGSLRSGSLNKKLIVATNAAIAALAPDARVDTADFREFEMPVYDGDAEDAHGSPEGALKLVARLQAADAVIFASPEYNGGISGAFKNALDWVSREDENPLKGKFALTLGASPGAFGAVRGLEQLSFTLQRLGVFVYPAALGVPRAHQVFGADGLLQDAGTQKRLNETLEAYLGFVRKVLKGSA